MKQFAEMTTHEQMAVLQDIALGAVKDMYGLKNAKVTWLAYTHNFVFDVQADEGHLVLRLKYPNRDAEHEIEHQWLQSEASILFGLHNAFGLPVPKPAYVWPVNYVLELYNSSARPDWPEALHGLMYYFTEGLGKEANTITSAEIQAIGELLAEIHNKGPKIEERTQVPRPNLDYEGLFSENGLYRLKPEAKALLSLEQIEVMDKVALIVKAAMDKLGQSEAEFGLIHGDLLLKNILFHEGEVRALDFEYCGWGYYLYDLCPLLWQLKPLANYKELEEALWHGYISICPLAKQHRELLETFIAGRQVASMRWVAANQHNPAYQGKVEAILQQRTSELEGFLKTGILTRS